MPFLLAADESGAARFLGLGLGAVLILLLVAYVVFVIAALVSILRSRVDGGMKLVWVILVFLAPFLGSVLWFVIGRKRF
ncbi:PLD nuclease N-terminal domain-containing protein [Amycolatopsis antarctica]|uniref:PLD nuclease N-terminal domain-containing protein n=1 Tax=Amycolatopsis antarctica TaxID=1854586 RepID=UPI001F0A1D90|nr:PLD nuclease N-terminal domain-containing protein [Amycolatopsis antarctica]